MSGSSSSNRTKMSSSSWQTKESRYYCAICNAWMGNDRQSIMVHENGKKHKEKLEASLQERRDNKVASDKQASQLQSSLKAMEQAALHSMATGHDSLYYDTTETLLSRGALGATSGPGLVPPPPPPPPVPSKAAQAPKQPSSKKEKQAWNERKKQRQDDKQGSGDKEDNDQQAASSSRRKRIIAPDEGHYTLDILDDEHATESPTQKTYLEGTVFAEILEEEMPIQIWVGSHLASMAEKRLRHNQNLWINGLVVSLKTTRKQPNDKTPIAEEDRMTVNVCYLKNPTDTEETMEQNVRLPRIRIVLGADESIPDTLEEARILALGGEEVQVKADESAQQPIIDEATGLSAWSTVTIKRTTVHQEAREERARERQKQRLAKRKAMDAKKEAEARKMEEAKVANAEDSALGAYDVWGQGTYKGVDIHKEAVISIADSAKKLAGAGEKVAFKKSNKSKFKMGGKKNNRRTTSADD